jgi:hypothetical protein
MVVVVVFNHPSTGFFKKVTQQVKDSGQEKRKTSCFSRPFNGVLLLEFLVYHHEIYISKSVLFSITFDRSVTDPRDGKRVALKKMPNVFQSLVSSKRVFRELKMLCFFKHDNVN